MCSAAEQCTATERNSRTTTRTPDSEGAASDAPTELASPSSDAPTSTWRAVEGLRAAIRHERERVADCTHSLLNAQQRIESLKIEHMAEGVDGRMIGAMMTTRLAHAQALQVAALARRLADGEEEETVAEAVAEDLSSDASIHAAVEPEAAADGSDPPPSSLLRFEALRLEHRNARDAIRNAITLEREGRESFESAEISEAVVVLAQARRSLQACCKISEAVTSQASGVGSGIMGSMGSIGSVVEEAEECEQQRQLQLVATASPPLQPPTPPPRSIRQPSPLESIRPLRLPLSEAEAIETVGEEGFQGRRAGEVAAVADDAATVKERVLNERQAAKQEAKQASKSLAAEADKRREDAEKELAVTRMMLAGGALARLSFDAANEVGAAALAWSARGRRAARGVASEEAQRAAATSPV